MKAPVFSLLDQHGVTHTLKEYAGKWIVLYFYPKDDTPGCTTEACSFRDVWSEFEKLGVVVLGLSADSVESHQKFAEKYHLTFPILSNPEKDVLEAYDTLENGKALRKTVIIDPEGELVVEYPNVTPDKHAEELLSDLKGLLQ